jgi:enoyl-[acyl-carrier protein] reductase II
MADFDGNRVVQDTGARYPIIHAPMGWIARSRLASAVSAAGGLGMIETSSGDFDAVKVAISRMAKLTQAPFGVNLPLLFLKRDDSIVDWLLDHGPKFVTTSAGDPGTYIGRLQAAGIKVYHAVASVDGAVNAEEAGVSGLIVEGCESASIRGRGEVHAFALLQAVRARTRLPIVAAGGIADGRGMAAAFALGAEGVQMGTRFVCSSESPVHDGYKAAITAAAVDGTVLVRRKQGAPVRALRSPVTEAIECGELYFGEALRGTRTVYFEGKIGAGLAPAGESAGLIDAVLPVSDIISGTVAGFWSEIDRLAMLRAPVQTAAG